MKISTNTLIILGALVGGYLFYKSRQKSNALTSDESDESLGGGGGGFGSGGSTTADILPTTTIVSPAPNYTIIKTDGTKETETTPTTRTPTTSTPITTAQPVSNDTEIKSSRFLTFDGDEAEASNVVLDFEGNVD